jgi:hypothetical protein
MSAVNTFAVNPIGIFSFLQKNIADTYSSIQFLSFITYSNINLSLNCKYSLESPTFLETELFKIHNNGITKDGKIHLRLEIKDCKNKIILSGKNFTLQDMKEAKQDIINQFNRFLVENPIFYFDKNKDVNDTNNYNDYNDYDKSELIIKKAINLLKESGNVIIIKNEPLKNYNLQYTNKKNNTNYFIDIINSKGIIYMNMANNKIRMILDIYNNKLSIYILSYYTTPRDITNKNEPKLDVLRDILKYCKYVHLDDTSSLKCNDSIKIPYSLIAFVNYPRLQLYEDIVKTPDIAIDIRNILTEKGELYDNICDINIKNLSLKLQTLINNTKITNNFNKYEKAFQLINELINKNIPQYIKLSEIANTLLPSQKYKLQTGGKKIKRNIYVKNT